MFSTRTTIIRGLVAALVSIPATLSIGCKGSSPAAPVQQAPAPTPRGGGEGQPTQIVGTASLLPGAAGDLGNAMAALYTSYDEWNRYQPVRFVRVRGNGPEVSFSFSNLVPGTYYVDVWKDSDNSARWSAGDFVGWFGNGSLGSPSLTPVQVREGQTTDLGDLFMYLIVNANQVGAIDKTDTER